MYILFSHISTPLNHNSGIGSARNHRNKIKHMTDTQELYTNYTRKNLPNLTIIFSLTKNVYYYLVNIIKAKINLNCELRKPPSPPPPPPPPPSSPIRRFWQSPSLLPEIGATLPEPSVPLHLAPAPTALSLTPDSP